MKAIVSLCNLHLFSIMIVEFSKYQDLCTVCVYLLLVTVVEVEPRIPYKDKATEAGKLPTYCLGLVADTKVDALPASCAVPSAACIFKFFDISRLGNKMSH